MTLYQEIRAAGKNLHSKAVEATKGQGFDPLRIAKRMTLPVVGRTLVFDDEVVQNGFFDFWTYEYRVNGKSLIQSMDPEAARLTPLEREVWMASCQARTSFFVTGETLVAKNQVRIRDLLEPDRPELELTDIGFSQSLSDMNRRLALFFRPITVRGITMTSGFSFLFSRARVGGLLQAYHQKMKKVAVEDLSEQGFVFFFQKYRQMGKEQRFEDVV